MVSVAKLGHGSCRCRARRRRWCPASPSAPIISPVWFARALDEVRGHCHPCRSKRPSCDPRRCGWTKGLAGLDRAIGLGQRTPRCHRSNQSSIGAQSAHVVDRQGRSPPAARGIVAGHVDLGPSAQDEIGARAPRGCYRPTLVHRKIPVGVVTCRRWCRHPYRRRWCPFAPRHPKPGRPRPHPRFARTEVSLVRDDGRLSMAKGIRHPTG